MERTERCQKLKELGYKYDPTTGKITGLKGKEIKRKRNGYVQINGTTWDLGYVSGHHFAWYWVYGNLDFEQLDHINRDRYDNRIENLRMVTNQQNQFNREPKGWYWHKIQKKFRAAIRLDGKLIDLGGFDTKEEAIKRYYEEKPKYHSI